MIGRVRKCAYALLRPLVSLIAGFPARHLKIICFLTFFFALQYFTAARAMAQDAPAGKPPQGDLWKVPDTTDGSRTGIRSDTPQLESPSAAVSIKLQEYRNNCLPLPDNFEELSSGSVYREGTYSQAAGIIKSAPNPCEASVELKLFLESQKGEWTFDRFLGESSSYGLRVVGAELAKKYILGMAVNPTLSIGVKLSQLVDEELRQRKANAPIGDALEIFRRTRGMKSDGIAREEAGLREKILVREKALDGLTVKYGQKLQRYMPNYPYDRFNPSQGWKTYFDKQLEFAREEAAERADIIYEIAGLEFQRSVLNDYRKPYAEKSCEEIMAGLQKDCPGAKAAAGEKPADGPKQPATPETTEKDRNDLFGDLCRCSCNPTVGGGSKFDPARGCVCIGVLGGEWVIPMLTSGECFNNITKTAGADPAGVASEARKIWKDYLDSLMAEAKRLIDEFWQATPAPFNERARKKTDAGDIEKAMGIADSVEKMEPSYAQKVQTFRRDASASLPGVADNVISDLMFDTSFRVLDGALQLNPGNGRAKEMLDRNRRWERTWAEMQRLSRECYTMLGNGRICECRDLYSNDIYRLQLDFNRVVPAKDRLLEDLGKSMRSALERCTADPWVAGQRKQIMDYRKSSMFGMVAQEAQATLDSGYLCDCNRAEFEKYIEDAQWEDRKVMSVRLYTDSGRTSLKSGERVYVHVEVKDFVPPYSLVWGGAVAGAGDQGGKVPFSYPVPGSYEVTARVTDARGREASSGITLTVEGKGPAGPPSITYDPTKDQVTKTAKKPVDVSGADQAGSSFQDGQKWKKPKDQVSGDRGTKVVQQPDDYTKQPEVPENKPETATPPYYYPPGRPDETGIPGTGRDWSKWATKGSGGDRGSGWKGKDDSSTKPGSDPPRDSAPPSTPPGPATPPSPPPGDQGGKNRPAAQDITAELQNAGNDNVHIFVEGRDSFGPRNRLAPGEKRKITVPVNSRAGLLKFVSGRNGQVLATCRWDYDLDALGNRVVAVRFSDPKNLSCATGYR